MLPYLQRLIQILQIPPFHLHFFDVLILKNSHVLRTFTLCLFRFFSSYCGVLSPDWIKWERGTRKYIFHLLHSVGSRRPVLLIKYLVRERWWSWLKELVLILKIIFH